MKLTNSTVKVKQLLIALQKLDPDANVVIYNKDTGHTHTIVSSVYLIPGTCNRPELKLVVDNES
jgi:hypothetical protein